METNRTSYVKLFAAAVIACSLGLMACDDNDPTGPLKLPPEPLLDLHVGTYWVYVDSVWSDDSLIVRTDTVRVADTVRDTLGFRYVLSEDMPWLHREVALLADTIATVEVGPGGFMLVQQFLPPKDTGYSYPIVIFDAPRERRVEWLDTTVQTEAGIFDSCISYTGEAEAGLLHRYVLARGIGFVFAEVQSGDQYAGQPQRWRSWLVKYGIEED